MPVVTLTTDFGGSGYYLAALKGVVLSVFPECRLEEVSQNIAAREFREAAFTIQKAFAYFPEKTIHIVHVHAADSGGRLLIAEFRNHIFLVFDNGTGPLIFEHEPAAYFEVKPEEETGSLFLKTIRSALRSIKGNTYKSQPTTPKKVLRRLSPLGNPGFIKGNILFIDKFGNAITNIHYDLWKAMIKSDFQIYINGYKVEKLSRFYSDIPPGEIGAFFNTANLLEIVMCNGKASELLRLRVDGQVMVEGKLIVR